MNRRCPGASTARQVGHWRFTGGHARDIVVFIDSDLISPHPCLCHGWSVRCSPAKAFSWSNFRRPLRDEVGVRHRRQEGLPKLVARPLCQPELGCVLHGHEAVSMRPAGATCFIAAIAPRLRRGDRLLDRRSTGWA